MNDLINEIGQKSRMLDAAIGELKVRGAAYSQAERDYRVALAEKMLKDGDPVCHVVRRSQLGKGIEENIVTLCPECHRAYDQGQNIEKFGKGTTRESLQCYLIAYLKQFYPNWTKEEVTYKKWNSF